MPKAGFWAIDPTRKIHFGKDGWWYANDERIQNQRINTLFSQCLHQTAAGSYEIVLGRDRADVEIEDTPYVVTQVTGYSNQGVIVRLNDKSEETLAPQTLSIGDNDVLYCRVKDQEHPARFLRSAYYQLTEYIHEDEKSGKFVLRTGETDYPILPIQCKGQE